MTEIGIMQPHHVLASSPRIQRGRLVSSDLQVRGQLQFIAFAPPGLPPRGGDGVTACDGTVAG